MNLRRIVTTLSLVALGSIESGAVFAEDKASSENDLLIAAQKICPVSGMKLGSMGEPVKAKSGEQTVFLCCKACLGKPISKENWAKVTANLASAQGKCPVMGKSLPSGASSVIVSGRRIFVCCPPCGPKIKADPARYISVVDGLLEKNVGGSSVSAPSNAQGSAGAPGHEGMQMDHAGMLAHNGMDSMSMGGCAMCMQMMGMDMAGMRSMNGGAAPSGRVPHPTYRSSFSSGGFGGGCCR